MCPNFDSRQQPARKRLLAAVVAALIGSAALVLAVVAITQALLTRGFSEERHPQVMGENVLRILRAESRPGER